MRDYRHRQRYDPALLDKLFLKGMFIAAHRSDALRYCAFYANDAENRSAYISLIAVLPSYQNLHIGTYLLHTSLDIAVSRGMQTCILEVKKGNDAAIGFYKSNGFTLLGERADSYLMNRGLC